MRGFQGAQGGDQAPYTALLTEGGPVYFTARGGQLSRWALAVHATAALIAAPLPLQNSELPRPQSPCDSQSGCHRGVLQLSCSEHRVSPPRGLSPKLLRNKN